jgi:hypothetical protein
MNRKNNEGEQDFEGLQKHLVHLKNKLKKRMVNSQGDNVHTNSSPNLPTLNPNLFTWILHNPKNLYKAM